MGRRLEDFGIPGVAQRISVAQQIPFRHMLASGTRRLLMVAVMGVVTSAIGGCTTSTPTSGSESSSESSTPTSGGSGGVATAPTTAGLSASTDVAVKSCKQDQNDSTLVDVSGTILNHASVTSDYSFVVDVLNNALPSAQTSVTEVAVPTGVVQAWSTNSTIAGSTSGSFTRRVQRVIRTPSHS